jgi:two-component system KDP operon response regulator KdpE
MDEVLAQLRAMLRRVATADVIDSVVATDAFTVDLVFKTVTRDGSEIPLTPREWAILEVLVRARGRLVRREELFEAVWGMPYFKQSHYLRVYLSQLRHKLEDDPARPVHLLTANRLGYRFRK